MSRAHCLWCDTPLATAWRIKKFKAPVLASLSEQNIARRNTQTPCGGLSENRLCFGIPQVTFRLACFKTESNTTVPVEPCRVYQFTKRVNSCKDADAALQLTTCRETTSNYLTLQKHTSSSEGSIKFQKKHHLWVTWCVNSRIHKFIPWFWFRSK